jgi:hypothetical protein
MFKFIVVIAISLFLVSCDDTTARKEQKLTEINQSALLENQPPPRITWSLERDNLIKRFKLQNDRGVMFYMYIFIEGVAEPIGYYQVNKVSSVNSQLTNPEQKMYNHELTLPSPAEDGSYGTNGDAVFGFTPEEIYIEHNMKYIVATVPLNFNKPVNRLTIINVETEKQLKVLMDKINK